MYADLIDRALLTIYSLRKTFYLVFCFCMTKLNPALPLKTETARIHYMILENALYNPMMTARYMTCVYYHIIIITKIFVSISFRQIKTKQPQTKLRA